MLRKDTSQPSGDTGEAPWTAWSFVINGHKDSSVYIGDKAKVVLSLPRVVKQNNWLGAEAKTDNSLPAKVLELMVKLVRLSKNQE